MTPHPLNPVLRHVRALGGARDTGLPDAVLLARFAADGDEDAFVILIRRYGPMVLGLCQRVIGDYHAAEDAFQATFLILAKKGHGLRRPDRLGPWLYGVARRVALKARSARNRLREVSLQDSAVKGSPDVHDLRPLLDAAIAGLPARYRMPVILCHLHGLTNAEAATRLRCPPGTLATRLSRARDRLRLVLARQGLAPTAGTLAAALSADATAAQLTDTLVSDTGHLAATFVSGSAVIPAPILTLVREGSQAMIFDKLKVLAFVGVLAVAGTGAAVALSQKTDDAGPPSPVAKADTRPAPAFGGERVLPLALLRQNPAEVYRIEHGDLLGVFIEGVMGERGGVPPIMPVAGEAGISPTVGFPVPVQEDGTIALPLIDALPVSGKTIPEIRRNVLDRYQNGGLMSKGGRVFVGLAKARTYRVTVVRPPDLGDLHTITILDLPAYQNDVLTAMGRSGGLANMPLQTEVVIQRGTTGNGVTAGAVIAGISQVRIPLTIRTDRPLPFKPEDVILKNGDVLTFECKGEQPATQSAGPAERPPAVTLAVATPDGRVLVLLPDGNWRMYDADKVTGIQSDGKPVANVADRLKQMTTVLLAAGGRKPGPYLQLAKPGTLILTIKD